MPGQSCCQVSGHDYMAYVKPVVMSAAILSLLAQQAQAIRSNLLVYATRTSSGGSPADGSDQKLDAAGAVSIVRHPDDGSLQQYDGWSQ